MLYKIAKLKFITIVKSNSSILNNIMLIILLCSFFIKLSFADVNESENSATPLINLEIDNNRKKEKINNILSQMAMAINSCDYKIISSFLSYYSSASANFLIKSILYTNIEPEKIESEESVSLTRDEYINYRYQIAKSANKYLFEINLDSIAFLDDSASIANVSIKETSINKTYKTIDQAKINSGNTNQQNTDNNPQIITTTTLVYTNCSISFQNDDIPIILASNCFEKIVIN